MKNYSLVLLVLILSLLCGCSAKSQPEPLAPKVETVAMQTLYEQIAAMQDMPEMVPLDADMQLNFCGVAEQDCAQCVMAICANGLRTDELWLIEAVDDAALARIQAAATARVTAKGEESITYSPEQYAVVEKAQMLTKGLYFFLVVSPQVDAVSDVIRSAA